MQNNQFGGKNHDGLKDTKARDHVDVNIDRQHKGDETWRVASEYHDWDCEMLETRLYWSGLQQEHTYYKMHLAQLSRKHNIIRAKTTKPCRSTDGDELDDGTGLFSATRRRSTGASTRSIRKANCRT
eukprot:8231019-Heterocapsa_arctica.AAC.1